MTKIASGREGLYEEESAGAGGGSVWSQEAGTLLKRSSLFPFYSVQSFRPQDTATYIQDRSSLFI